MNYVRLSQSPWLFILCLFSGSRPLWIIVLTPSCGIWLLALSFPYFVNFIPLVTRRMIVDDRLELRRQIIPLIFTFCRGTFLIAIHSKLSKKQFRCSAWLQWIAQPHFNSPISPHPLGTFRIICTTLSIQVKGTIAKPPSINSNKSGLYVSGRGFPRFWLLSKKKQCKASGKKNYISKERGWLSSHPDRPHWLVFPLLHLPPSIISPLNLGESGGILELTSCGMNGHKVLKIEWKLVSLVSRNWHIRTYTAFLPSISHIQAWPRGGGLTVTTRLSSFGK
jgi:hypothetical protein